MPRSPAWMVLWSLAAAAHGQTEVPPVADRPADGGSAPAGQAANGTGLRFRLPPVLWTGSLAIDLGYNRSDEKRSNLSADRSSSGQYRILTTSLGATTYIYAPWAATVSARLNLSNSADQYEVDGRASTVNGEFATGGLNLSLFPLSRFPTELRYDVSDTRVDSTLGGGAGYRSSTFGLNHRYRPANSSFSLSGSYERRAQEGLSFGRDTQDNLLLDYATGWKRQQLSAALNHNRNRTEATAEQADFTSVYARHTYSDADSLSIDTGASWTHADDQLRSGDRTLTTAQLSSVAIWKSPTMPLNLTGSLRAASFQQGRSTSAQSLAASLGASYILSRNAGLAGSVSVSRSNSQTTLTTTGQLSANYQGDMVKLGPFEWAWYSGAGLGLSYAGRDTNASLSAQVGQSLNRTWLTGDSTWSASLGQSFSASHQQRSSLNELPVVDEGRVSRAVTNTLSVGWTQPVQQGSATARLTLADARQLNGEQSQFQQANAQVSGVYQLSRYARWEADLSLQYTTQGSLVSQSGDDHRLIRRESQEGQSASGAFAWHHDRLFNVPRLRFSSRLRVSKDAQSRSRELVPIPDRELVAWENRLEYRVGRLDSTIALRVSRVDERQQVFATWRVQRTF